WHRALGSQLRSVPREHRARLVETLLEDPKHVQLTTLRDMIQASGLGHGGGTDGAELVAQIQTSGDRKTDPTADAGVDADILLTAHLPSGRVADDAGTKLAAPQDLTGVPVDSAEVATKRTVEHQTTVGDHRTTPVRV